MKMTVVVQYLGHVIHAGGLPTFRTVEIELTPEQQKQLILSQDEYFGTVVFQESKPSSAA